MSPQKGVQINRFYLNDDKDKFFFFKAMNIESLMQNS